MIGSVFTSGVTMIGKIHKSGQGYWTRMTSGIGAGVLVAWGALWLWSDLEAAGVSIYIRAAVVVAVVGVFGLILFRYLGTNPKTCDFLIATEGEMKKVNWPSRREVFGSTWIVICCTAMFVAVLAFSDAIFLWFFRAIRVLEK